MPNEIQKRVAYEKVQDKELPYVHVVNYNEKEESTCVEVAILLNASCFKTWVIVPLLSIITAFVFSVFLFWKPALQRDWMYKRAKSVKDATHVYIEGSGKYKHIKL